MRFITDEKCPRCGALIVAERLEDYNSDYEVTGMFTAYTCSKADEGECSYPGEIERH